MSAPSPESSSPPAPPTSHSTINTSSPPPSTRNGPPTRPPSPPQPSQRKITLSPSLLSPSSSPSLLSSPSPPSHVDVVQQQQSNNKYSSSSPSMDSKADGVNIPGIPAHGKDIDKYVAIGIGAGFAAFLFLIVTICVCCTKKRKKSKDSIGYYADTSARKGKNVFYSSGLPAPKWQNRHGHAAPAAGGGWQNRPHPHTIMSGESSGPYTAPHAPVLPPPSPTMALGLKSTFTYEELVAATGGFSPSNLLGQGGFGYVHKGVLPNGKEIAVKQLRAGSGQGEREFQAEVDIISRVHHRHLVSLVGYCIAGTQRMLVYDFVPNRTLEYHLHAKGLAVMDWPTRLKIATGAAKGIAYLHEDCHPRIIHRDIKSANILLDNKFEAMVADFGLAKLSSDNHTHVSTRVMGTFGYLAPEYASSGKLTEKSDVFSFGVMMLEIITGKRPVDTSHNFMEDSMVDWARPLMQRCMADGSYDELVDPRLENNYNELEMARLVACANACVKQSAKRRPKMSQIVRALEGDVSLEDLNEGVRPGSILFSSGSDFNDSGSYTSNMNRFRKVTLASPEFSGDYSTDFGHHPSASSSDDIFSGEINPTGGNKHRLR